MQADWTAISKTTPAYPVAWMKATKRVKSFSDMQMQYIGRGLRRTLC